MWQTTLYDTSKLTLELRDIVDNGENSVDIWNFDYPSFYKGDEKARFEKKVIDHYYFRQIGSETVGRFLHQFRTRIREIMPYYIKLYELEKKFLEAGDPFQSYDLTETYEGNTTGKATSKGSGTVTRNEDHERKFSNTPQGSISNIDDYMTEAEKNTSDDIDTSENQSEDNSEGTNNYTMTRKGNIGVQPLGVEFTANWQGYINIDLMVIEALNDLFLGIY